MSVADKKPKSNSVNTRKSAEGKLKRKNAGATRMSIADKKPKSSAVLTKPRLRNVGKTTDAKGKRRRQLARQKRSRYSKSTSQRVTRLNSQFPSHCWRSPAPA